MQNISIDPFNRLVKLTARAFYDDVTTKGENQIKSGRSDNRGIAVVVLDSLTRRQWVREEDLAKDLKLHSKQLRRTLRFFEEEKLVTRDHRRETAKGSKVFSTAIAAVAEGHHAKEGEEKIKMHTHSYCCLDYAQIHDVVRYRLHRMKKKLKDELDNKNTIQEYICPNCSKRYNALDALQLISMEDEYFHCENCNGELVAESDNLASQEGGDGDDNARRRRREKLKEMLQTMEAQLKPLMEQLNRIKDLDVPEFGTLQAWEARASAAARQNGDYGSNDSSKTSNGLGYSGTPSLHLGPTTVEVDFSGGVENGEDNKSGVGIPALKVLPPWMIKQGMQLTEEQRGEVKKDNSSASVDVKDDKKSTVVEDNEDYKMEYLKAYYAAMTKNKEEEKQAEKMQELLNAQIPNGVQGTSPNRQVGMKSKRDEDDDDDGWEEEAPITGTTSESYKVDLNVEADASGDDDDGSDWEEG